MHTALCRKYGFMALPFLPVAPSNFKAFLNLLGPNDTIAVVGSSGNLLHSNKGAEIDAHTVIVRANAAVVTGYERDVGSRTDMRILWNDESTRLARSHGIIGPQERVLLTTPGATNGDFETNSANQWRGRPYTSWARPWWQYDVYERILDSTARWPSTGFFAIAAGMALAKRVGARPVSVYGFGPCAGCGVYYRCHYAVDGTTESTGRNGWHSFGKEREGARHASQTRSCVYELSSSQ